MAFCWTCFVFEERCITAGKNPGFLLGDGSLSGGLRADLLLLGFSDEQFVHPVRGVRGGLGVRYGLGPLVSLVHTGVCSLIWNK